MIETDGKQVPYLEPNTMWDELFAINPEPRCPCVLLLDVSNSMEGEPIAALNAGVATLLKALKQDAMAQKRVEIAMVEFGPVQVISDWRKVDLCPEVFLQTRGGTPMGAAIEQGIDLVAERKAVYKDNGMSYFRPWIFLLTDGEPTDNWQNAAQRVQRGEAANEFAFYAVGVGDADLSVLRQISVREPLRLKGLMFREMFQWLSCSLQSISRASVGAEVGLENPLGPKGWATAR